MTRDYRLKFQEHVNRVISKAMRVMEIIGKVGGGMQGYYSPNYGTIIYFVCDRYLNVLTQSGTTNRQVSGKMKFKKFRTLVHARS